MVGINNVLDTIFPQFAVDIVASYYYPEYFIRYKLKQRQQSAFYRELRIIHVELKRHNIRHWPNETDNEKWDTIFHMPKHEYSFHVQWIYDNELITFAECEMVIKSYENAGINIMGKIIHNEVFQDGVYPSMGTRDWAIKIIQQFLKSDISIIKHFIIQRKHMGATTNVSYTIGVPTTKKERCLILKPSYQATLDIVHMYAMGDVSFIREFTSFYACAKAATTTIRVVSNWNTRDDIVTVV